MWIYIRCLTLVIIRPCDAIIREYSSPVVQETSLRLQTELRTAYDGFITQPIPQVLYRIVEGSQAGGTACVHANTRTWQEIKVSDQEWLTNVFVLFFRSENHMDSPTTLRQYIALYVSKCLDKLLSVGLHDISTQVIYYIKIKWEPRRNATYSLNAVELKSTL